MKVIILSCGESVKRFNPAMADNAITIGINRIPATYQVDYWVFGDWWNYVGNKPIGKPPIVLPESQSFYLKHNCGSETADIFSNETIIHWEELINPLPPDKQLCFSFCASMLFASHLNATEIEIFGADMNGKKDWDGKVPFQSYREEERWIREKDRIAIISGWLESKGVSIKWHTFQSL